MNNKIRELIKEYDKAFNKKDVDSQLDFATTILKEVKIQIVEIYKKL